ncbi:MAG: hypothetical protein EZS28_050009 [Streblomastix strix]|uniref:Uncharacterized protein n=1 Tax=Streblomastix strix TaxID=222440 RepID=A0A5J4T7V3_9EUKA|nr:MAG: hypothetical protein EZS28_050009 [Streblomastix strix]
MQIDYKVIESHQCFEAERIAAEQRQRAQQKYRIQRQEFRSSANDLQLLLIRRLQKTIITNVCANEVICPCVQVCRIGPPKMTPLSVGRSLARIQF